MPRLRPDQVAAHIKASAGQPMRKISDGQSLYLITRNGRGYWSYQWREGTSFRTLLLGSASDMSPAKARHAREEKASERRKGKPAERRGAANRAAHPVAAMSIAASGEAAGELLSDLLIRYVVESAPGWKSAKPILEGLSEAEIVQLVRDGKAGKEAKSYTTMFNRIPDMMTLPAQSISPLAYRNAVKAIWPENAATVERMVKRLGILLKYQREGKRKKPKARNHEAMPYNDVPSFMAHLLKRPTSVGARALRWTILSGVRADETLSGTWREITEVDGEPVWAIPPERTKTGKTHNIPLTPAMLAILGERGPDDQPLIVGGAGGFPNAGVMYQFMKRWHKGKPGRQPVPHGFRTSFRSWAADCTDYPREIAEKALGHVVPGNEGAYQRGELLAKRRKLMEDWSAFCVKPLAAS
jgi:integrase